MIRVNFHREGNDIVVYLQADEWVFAFPTCQLDDVVNNVEKAIIEHGAQYNTLTIRAVGLDRDTRDRLYCVADCISRRARQREIELKKLDDIIEGMSFCVSTLE